MLIDFENSFQTRKIFQPTCNYRYSFGAGTVFHVLAGKEPCWFHRKMQTLLLGIKWEYIGK